jgi:flagellar export protein FliJ
MVNKSKSRLGVLRRVRTQEENTALQGFVRCRRDVDDIRSRIDRLERALSHRTSETRRGLLDRPGARSTDCSRLAVEVIRAAISHEKARLVAASKALQKTREVLLEAAKRRKAIDWLQRKRRSKVDLTRSRNDSKEADDLHAMRAVRRQGRYEVTDVGEQEIPKD